MVAEQKCKGHWIVRTFRRHIDVTKMRVTSLSRDFGIILIALVVLHHTRETNANLEETCPLSNCLPAEQCEELVKSSKPCMIPENVCCSIVKGEFRTMCRHHGGECMDSCPSTLARSVTDCSSNQVCCVLV